jgi:hypothetical protein
MRTLVVAVIAALLCSSLEAQFQSSSGVTWTNDAVGIGTSSPATKLSVSGANNTGSAKVTVDRYITNGESAILFRTLGDATSQWEIGKVNSENLAFLYGTNTVPSLVVDTTGNVGIGTAAPAARVHLYNAGAPVGIRIENGQTAGSTGMFAIDNVIGPYVVSHTDTAGLSTTQGAFAAHRVNFGAGPFAIAYSAPTAAGNARVWANQLTIDQTGRVAIGSQGPAATLDVNGPIKGNSHLSFMPWTNAAWTPVNGYVRLMTPIADHESNMFSLHIYGYLYQGDVSAIDVRCSAYAYGDATSGGLIQKACTTVGTSLPVEITTEPSGATNNVVVRIGSLSTSWYYPYLAVEYDGWQIKDPAAFVWSVQSAVPAGAPALTNMNNVVIAPTNGGSIVVGQPGGTGTRLTVHGDAVVDGNLAAKYQDVAEWVPADASLATGTVVVLDRHAANRVTASTRAYDTGVAGVVSAKPGVILGEAGAEKAKIATTGRVRVKVDASHAAVGIGDLLVTSDTPGFAMKSEPLEMHGRSFHQPGTLIGKALEPLAAGKGEILVLLSLQ